MELAYLILCHTDPIHIARLVKKLASDEHNKVYIHVDIKSDINLFRNAIGDLDNVHFCKNRYDAKWGSFTAIQATMELIKESLSANSDRFILLQGLDYPLYSNSTLSKFFESHSDVEFIRACNVSKSKDYYFWCRIKQAWFFSRVSKVFKLWHKFNKLFKLPTRSGRIISSDDRDLDVYFGHATWALTQACVQYIYDFYLRELEINNFFTSTMSSDELYIHTVVFNSTFKEKTTKKGPEPEQRNLVNWMNLEYFEYNDSVKVFESTDFSRIYETGYVFIRKVTSDKSNELLNLIDDFESASPNEYQEYVQKLGSLI
ncbi:beta-1,6-N-acetylglucosaminyltransferase [Paraglaciecola sp. 2405UD69-4]|uniref:beta-1,6-N-acetylglucosaminyltransferase n=1 Tax=Paraglaciecola sp. 2405UD69-4 TaxID=3391836 RepID=UPI0039C9879F